MRQIFSRYARSGIGNGNGHNCFTPCPSDADANLAMWLVVVDSVGEKVGNELVSVSLLKSYLNSMMLSSRQR